VDEDAVGRPTSFNFNGLLTMSKRPMSKRSFAAISIKDSRDVGLAGPLCVSLNDPSVEGNDSSSAHSQSIHGRQSLFDSAERVAHMSVGGFENADSGLSGLGSAKFFDTDFGVAGGASASSKPTGNVENGSFSSSGSTYTSGKATATTATMTTKTVSTPTSTSSGKAKSGAIKGTLKRAVKTDDEVLEI